MNDLKSRLQIHNTACWATLCLLCQRRWSEYCIVPVFVFNFIKVTLAEPTAGGSKTWAYNQFASTRRGADDNNRSDIAAGRDKPPRINHRENKTVHFPSFPSQKTFLTSDTAGEETIPTRSQLLPSRLRTNPLRRIKSPKRLCEVQTPLTVEMWEPRARPRPQPPGCFCLLIINHCDSAEEVKLWIGINTD